MTAVTAHYPSDYGDPEVICSHGWLEGGGCGHRGCYNLKRDKAVRDRNGEVAFKVKECPVKRAARHWRGAGADPPCCW